MRKLFLFFLLGLAACGNQQTNTPCQDDLDISKIELKVEVIRLEDELFACKSKQDIKLFVAKYDTLFRRYDRYPINKPQDSLASRLWDMVQNKFIDTLYKDVKIRFDDAKRGKWQQVAADFERAFKHIKHAYPTFQAPKIYTTITGLGSFWGAPRSTDIYMDKQAIIVSLDFYYGKGARYRPPVEKTPAYIWNRFVAEAIVPTCLLNISNLYNATDNKDKTLIAKMVDFGKAYTFVRHMMPCLPDSTLAGYTKSELANLNDKENKEYIWSYMIEKKVLFSDSPRIEATYMGESPYIAEINKKCPGRIGCWIGWKILQKYQKKNPQISIQALMSKKNAREIFEGSGFNGN